MAGMGLCTALKVEPPVRNWQKFKSVTQNDEFRSIMETDNTYT